MIEADQSQKVTAKEMGRRLGTRFTDSYLTSVITHFSHEDPKGKEYWQGIHENLLDEFKNVVKLSELKPEVALREVYRAFIEEVDDRSGHSYPPVGLYEGRLAARTVYGFVLPMMEVGFEIEKVDRTNIIDDIAQGFVQTPIRPSSLIKLFTPVYDVAEQSNLNMEVLDKIVDEIFIARQKMNPSPDFSESQIEADKRVVSFLKGPTIYAD